MPHLDGCETERRDNRPVVSPAGVVNLERAHDEVAPERDIDIGLNAVDVRGRLVPVDVGPNAQQPVYGFNQLVRHVQVPGLVVDEHPLGEVVRDAGGVIHVPVGQEDVVDRQRLARRAPGRRPG